MASASDRYLVASLEFEGVLRACLHRYARNIADVDELLQETYTHLLAAGSQPREEIRSIRAFALTVARNVALSWLRHRQVVPIELVADMEQLELLDERGQVDEIVNTHQELALLTAAVARLPARCRQVFTLRKVYGLSQKEIAAELKISENTVEQHLAKGVRLCSAALATSPWLKGARPGLNARAAGRNVNEHRPHRAAGQPLAGAARRRFAMPHRKNAFEQWLQADIRHRVTYLRLEAAWRRGDRLRDLRPLDRSINPDLLRPPRRYWTLAIAASVLLALLVTGLFFADSQLGWQRYETRIGGFSRIVLDDGSVIDLNTDSDVRVRIGSHKREVRLERGEGRFQVAHDATRPFTVSAANADVRAVGTAFSVRLHDSKQVDVLVSEGTVAIAAARVAARPAGACRRSGRGAVGPRVRAPHRAATARASPVVDLRSPAIPRRFARRGRQRIQSLQPPAIEAGGFFARPAARRRHVQRHRPGEFCGGAGQRLQSASRPRQSRLHRPSTSVSRDAAAGWALRGDSMGCNRTRSQWRTSLVLVLLLALRVRGGARPGFDLRVPDPRAGRGQRPDRVRHPVANAGAVRL